MGFFKSAEKKVPERELMYKYNYNKKFVEKKIFINNLKKQILLDLFYSRFPKTLIVSKTKNYLKKGKLLKNAIKNKNMFFNNEYIYYNQYTFNFFILDVDHKNYKINDFITILDQHFIAAPNWIVETRGGYQLGFILEKPFNLDSKHLSESDKRAIKYTKYLLKKMLYLFGGDFNTVRLQGFWKNPLGVNLDKYRLFVNNKNYFNLSDFDIYLPAFDEIQKKVFKEKKKGNEGGDFHHDKIKIKYFVEEVVSGNLNILKSIDIGYRNAFLWYTGMYLIKIDPNWEERLNTYNINLKKPINNTELDGIKRSIKNYTREKKNWITLGKYELWTPELKSMYINNYRKKKGIIKHHRYELKEINKNKVLQAIYKLRGEGKKLTNKNISEYSKLGLTTVKKYKKELKKDPRFSCLFEKK